MSAMHNFTGTTLVHCTYWKHTLEYQENVQHTVVDNGNTQSLKLSHRGKLGQIQDMSDWEGLYVRATQKGYIQTRKGYIQTRKVRSEVKLKMRIGKLKGRMKGRCCYFVWPLPFNLFDTQPVWHHKKMTAHLGGWGRRENEKMRFHMQKDEKP